jgi:hypothetical protein
MDSKTRKLLENGFAEIQTAEYKELFELFRLVVSNFMPLQGSRTMLCILHRVDALMQDDKAIQFLVLRTGLERLNIHLLITGTIRGSDGNFDWGADSLARVDEDTEFKGMKILSIPFSYSWESRMFGVSEFQRGVHTSRPSSPS